MFKINGKYADAVIYSGTAEDYAIAQVKAICDNEASEGSKICMMPDIHPGKVAPIGLTMTVGKRILPNLIGADIGCGISYIHIKNTNIEFQKLDKVIRERIPSGFNVRKEAHHLSSDFEFSDLLCRKHINEIKAKCSLGTLGSGNHFIELDKDNKGNIYAVVHSGSRHLGQEVTEFYLKEGQKQLKAKEIELPYELTYLKGQLMEDYLHDIKVVQEYAMLNRKIILTELAKGMKWKVIKAGESIHNYVDENGILRKGAVAAYAGNEVIIPINMKDGILLGTGKGNHDWNYSAPHGSGRTKNRKDIKSEHTLAEFKRVMKGIYSTSVTKENLDEAPFAYRNMESILEAITDTVEVQKILKPIYNFKG